jgi:hypothetical protein
MSSVLQVRPAGSATFIDVPALRGKSAYQHAIEGGLDIESEQLFNEILGNLYKIEIAGTEPSTGSSDKIITIVLDD